MKKLNHLISTLTIFLVLNCSTGFSQGCWADDGWELFDPAGPSGPGFDVACDCATANAGTSGVTNAYFTNDNAGAEYDLTSASSDFCYTFEIDFGTQVDQGDGFVFIIANGPITYGGSGGNLGYANVTADHLAFEWDSYENDASVFDGAGATAPHIDINGYNGADESLVNAVDIGTAAQEIDGNAVTSTICWVSDGSGGGTFTMTYGGTSLPLTLTSAELSAYDFATSATFTFASVTNTTDPQDQGACIVGIPVSISFIDLNISRLVNDQITLDWEINEEEKVEYFVVEKSYNSKDWIELGTLNASVYHKENNIFQFVDNDDYSGLIYYRINIVNMDGEVDMSDAIAFDNYNNKDEFRILINGDQIFINGNNSFKRINLSTLEGKNVVAISSTEEMEKINTSSLRKGIYILSVQNNESIKTQRIIVK